MGKTEAEISASLDWVNTIKTNQYI
jgi:hypothetical protein